MHSLCKTAATADFSTAAAAAAEAHNIIIIVADSCGRRFKQMGFVVYGF